MTNIRDGAAKDLHLLERSLGAVYEPVPRNVPIRVEIESAVQGLSPFSRKGGPHRRKHPVHEDLAHEHHTLIWNADQEIRRRVGAPEEQNFSGAVAQIDRFDLADLTWARFDASPVRLDFLQSLGMNNEDRVRRQGGGPARVILVHRADDHPSDRLVGDRRDRVQQRLGRLHTLLPIREQDAVAPDDDQRDRREARFTKRFISVNSVSKGDDPRKVSRAQPALRRNGGPDLGGGGERRRPEKGEGENDDRDEA